jgi:hypothetical protein
MELRVYAVLLCLACTAFFFARFPSAISILGFTVTGLWGYPEEAKIHYIEIVPTLQVAAIGLLAYQVIRANKITALWDNLKACRNIYSLCIAVMWFETAVACLFEMNPDRREALKVALCSVWLPLAIIALSAAREGPEKCCRGIIWGLALYSAAHIIALVPGMFLSGRIQDALLGAARLTTYNQHTIDGSRFFFFGSCGWLVLGFDPKTSPFSRVARFGVAGFFFVLLALNGTRQYFLGVLVLAFVVLWARFAKKRLHLVVATALLIVAGIVASAFLGKASAVERLGSEDLEAEVSVVRGAIWADALEAAARHPFFGVGFREFGEDVLIWDEETDEVFQSKDSAHGFFTSIAAEHGLILAAITLCAALVYSSRFARALDTRSSMEIGFVGFVAALSFAENFSCSVFNAVGYHFFALLPMLFVGTLAFASRPKIGDARSRAALRLAAT